MIVFDPSGNTGDWILPAEYYDGTYRFISSCGIKSID
jgi:hypothetical protein